MFICNQVFERTYNYHLDYLYDLFYYLCFCRNASGTNKVASNHFEVKVSVHGVLSCVVEYSDYVCY